MLFPQKIWMLNLKLQPCEATETILLKNILYGDVKPPSKKLSCPLSFSMVARFLWKTYRPPLKEHCWHLFGKERYLFGGKVSFTKNKVHQPHFLWKSKNILKIWSAHSNHTIYFNICNAPFEEIQLPFIWTGTPFIWKKYTHHKGKCIFPKASHFKGKLPSRHTCACLAYNYCLSGVRLIQICCHRGHMNQINQD